MNNSLPLNLEKYQTIGNMTSTVVLPNSATIFAAICACIFVVVGIAGNLITIIALLQHQKLRGHATTAFVLSLCISDLLFCSFSMPLTAIRYINKAWTLGETLCKIFPVIFYSNVAVSLLSMVGITLNRYILIAHHHLYARIYRPHIIALQLFVVWFFAISTMIPPLFSVWGTLGLDEKTFSCTILKKDGKSIKKFLFLVGFLLPCIVIIISYSCIYYTVRRQRQKLNKHISSSAPITGASSKSIGAAREREDSRLTAMMLTIFICFLLCFLPLTVVNLFDDKLEYPWINTIASVLAWASSVINPFIYAASNRTYRVAYFKLFSAMKFWGEPLSPMPSKSFLPSKGSRDNGSNGNFNGKV
ncbi:protein trapped in endoderm-1 isoform X2 [Contarinia nasturtii]|uniref:protein trapped in endoderm-1 isoform X2 n=1 Tax=Contarinia nasturtii TaxID=265458 RepID=UPI0012D3B213|nr:protein trapped in endoderm-1 isoform X2 [Contarinia nasturtii]